MMDAILIAWTRFAGTLVNYTLGALVLALLVVVAVTAYRSGESRGWGAGHAGEGPGRPADGTAPSHTG